LLRNDEFFVSGKKSKILGKKKSPSLKTGEVEVDISIETYLNGAEEYSFLTVIECRNYKGKIPINDIREFGSVLNEIEIGEHNTKGILISSSAFQQGTINFAKSTKIGLTTD